MRNVPISTKLFANEAAGKLGKQEGCKKDLSKRQPPMILSSLKVRLTVCP
jgi:hypothetical protein